MGRFLDHSPPGERKSGMPHSVEMPAPVKGTMTRERSISFRSRSMAVSRSGAIIDTKTPSTKVFNHFRSERIGDAISAHHAARAQSRCGAGLLLQQARIARGAAARE